MNYFDFPFFPCLIMMAKCSYLDEFERFISFVFEYSLYAIYTCVYVDHDCKINVDDLFDFFCSS